MAQRFTGGPQGPAATGPPPSRYPPPPVPPLRQYAGPTFPLQQRPGFTAPPTMGSPAGPNLMPRPPQQPPYSPMRQGPIAPQSTSKRPADSRPPPPQQKSDFSSHPASHPVSKKKKKLSDKILPQKVRDLVPESQAYMDLLAFERKLDSTIMRKRLDIQEALKRPMKQKRKLRIFISNTFYPAKEPAEGEEGSVASWELRVEGRLLEDSKNDPNKVCLTCLERDPSWKPVLPSADTTTPEKKNAILQVEGCCTQSTGFIGVRLRNKCIFYSIIQDHGCAPSLEICGESESVKPFVGLDLCSEPKAQYCTISTDQTVKVWDLATMRCSLACEGKSKTRRHRNQIQFSPSGQELILSNSHSINLLDLRSRTKQKLPFSRQLDLLPCEEVSLVFPSRRSRHLLYVATTHKLALLDKRSSPCEAVTAWSHQMSSPPLYSHTLLLPSSQEVICVANQKPATVQLAVPSSHQLLKLNTIKDSLHQAQARGECLDPFLNTRLDQSLLGITCLPSDREETGFSLLSLTAAGDVFHQSVQAGSTTRKGQGLRGTLPVPAKKLYVTKRCNMKKLYSGLRNENLKLTREPETTAQQAWQRSKSSLLSSTDLLSSVVLDMWDLDECPDWSEEMPGMHEEEAAEEFEAVRKVSSWLETVSHPSQDDDSSSEHSVEMFQSQK